MSEIWGPALDAEHAYRLERARAVAGPWRRRNARKAAARRAARAAATLAVAPAPVVRGWRLSGSGAWPAAL
ncbi:MAG: hypothetical protein HGA44_20245 [Cellulomonadaceae bacterium]|nr:hypothetical protein [Cellulomonadaceae bacterium]